MGSKLRAPSRAQDRAKTMIAFWLFPRRSAEFRESWRRGLSSDEVEHDSHPFRRFEARKD